MDCRRLFIDSDVLLDLILNREPYFGYTQLLIIERHSRKLDLNTSALIVANIHYIISKKLGAKAATEGIRNLVKLINILPFETDIIPLVLNSGFTDFEDGIQHFIANRYHCDAIITRNVKDYKESTLPVYTTEQYLNKFN